MTLPITLQGCSEGFDRSNTLVQNCSSVYERYFFCMICSQQGDQSCIRLRKHYTKSNVCVGGVVGTRNLPGIRSVSPTTSSETERFNSSFTSVPSTNVCCFVYLNAALQLPIPALNYFVGLWILRSLRSSPNNDASSCHV